jgi:hypothetical protein
MPRPLATDRLAAIEAAIVARIREFEVPALLDLLASIGHAASDVEFRAHPGSGPQPTLLHAIEFPPRRGAADTGPRVIVTVNLGLLSCRSPLPSYFQRFFRRVDTHDPVIELIEVLDRALLHTRLTCDRPDAGWDRTRRDFLRIFGLDSPLGLDWLFRRVFPELEIRLRRTSDEYRVPYDGATLGTSKIGECSFGDVARIGVHDMAVVLVCGSANYHPGVPWLHEGDRRLRSFVFPLLDEVCMTLTVAFVLLDRGEGLQLGPTGFANYHPMWQQDVTAGATPPPGRIELYRGALPRHEPDTEFLEQVLADAATTALQLEATELVVDADTSTGRVVALPLLHHPRGHRPHRYRATLHWGARRWYCDDPHAVELRCAGVPKSPPTAREHPHLWALLRAEARARIADGLTLQVLPAGESRVTAALIERLVDEQAEEQLYALYWSRLVPMPQWEDEAWRRFSSWSAP